MAVAKNPGVGQGRGGGRPKGKTNAPKEEREVKPVQLRLSPRVVELIQAAAEAGKVRPWRVVELAILAMAEAGNPITVITPEPTNKAQDAPTLAPDVLEIAGECAAFLDAQVNRPAALKALRRAWRQALVLARHDLRLPSPEDDLVDAEEFMAKVLGETLRKAREVAGLTQAQLASKIKLSQSTVSAAEKGKHEVGSAYAALVLGACGLPENWKPSKDV